MDTILLDSLANTFQSEEDCEKFLIKSRWSKGFFCPRSDHDSFYKVKTRKLLECKECRTQISITAGTVLHKSKLSLLIWFKAIRLIIEDEMTYTIPLFATTLGVNYRTAKLLLEKIQWALNKRYARYNAIKDSRAAEEAPEGEEVAEPINEENASNLQKTPRYNTIKNTKFLHVYLFRTAKNVRYAEVDLFKKWKDAFFSVYLYPHFLRYFQVL